MKIKAVQSVTSSILDDDRQTAAAISSLPSASSTEMYQESIREWIKTIHDGIGINKILSIPIPRYSWYTNTPFGLLLETANVDIKSGNVFTMF